jgi:predicted nucleotidyltransferase
MKYNKEKREIILDKELNKIDKFTFDFISIIEKYVDYVIISGYVSILLGRSRATEDVDIFIKNIPKAKFIEMYKDLIENNFWCINSDNPNTLFDYLDEGLAIRFAKGRISLPNIEVKFPKDELDEEVFNDFISVKLPVGVMKISSLERHIAFKKYFLGDEKDNEDALHVEELFKEDIDYEKIKKLKRLIKLRQDGIRKRRE